MYGPDGAALFCGMDCPGLEPRLDKNFFFLSVSFQADPVPHPAISMMGAGASFPGMKRP